MKMKRHFKTLMMVVTCMAMVLCVSCKKDKNDEPTGGGTGVTGDSDGSIFGHDFVDLKLPSGTLWATCNVGANTPAEYGKYFAWGEITTKNFYSWDNYKWCSDDFYTLTKYNTDTAYGNVDNKTVLDLQDDVAYANWGGEWRVPTYEQMMELKDNCTWTWLQDSKGFKVTGANGKSIFLPANGHYTFDLYQSGAVGYYWSGSLYSQNSRKSYYLYICSTGLFVDCERRSYGHSIRPVYNPPIK